jgi:hypothetical protein
MDLTLEWANATDTTLYRQPLFGDIWTDVAYTPKSFWKIAPTVGLRAIWGSSIEAQANGSVLKLGPSASFSRAFASKIGEFELSLGTYALYNFVTNTSGGVGVAYSCASTAFTPTSCSQNTGQMDTRVTWVNAVSGKYAPISKLSINLSYIVIDNWAYNLPKATISDQTGGTQTVANQAGDTRFRQSGWFLASVDYDALSWLSLSLGYYCYRPILDPNSKYGDPFYYPGENTRIFLTTVFNLDQAYLAIARRARRNTSN